jgi:flagellar hook-associated protein 2
MSGLANISKWNTLSGTSSNTSVASIQTTSGSQAGTYNLTVSNLATAQKISSAGQSSTTTALGLTGTFVINGKALDVSNTDTLTSIAQKINGDKMGVTASLINGGGANGAYLTLTSNATGAANAVQVSDLSGSVMQTLGIIGGTTSIRNPITNGALSGTFSSQTTALGTLMGGATPGSGSFTLNGTTVNVNFATDTLSSVAADINSANAGVTASIQSVTTNGTTGYQLQIVSNAGPLTTTDPNGLLGSLGVLQNNYGDQLIQATDASYKLDTVNLTSATNTITGVIPGTTITLLSGTASTPGTSTLSISTDTSAIDTAVQQFVSDYNAVGGFIAQESSIDPTSYATGPLFGDFTTQQVQSELSSALFNNVLGTASGLQNLSQLGFSLSQTGVLALNQTTFDNALNANPSGVAQLFASSGSSTATGLSYVSATPKTVATGNPYSVNITQAATQSTLTAGSAQTMASTNAEQLTFDGQLFGNSSYVLTLNIGNSLQDTVNQINGDATASQYVTASINNGALELTSKMMGTPSTFTVTSNVAAGADNTGIGTGGNTYVQGLDVAGTINGEAATGNGTYLTGNAGNATSDGLEVNYTGTSTGAVGSINYTNGIASQINNQITNMTNSTNGIFVAATNSMTQQVASINTEIAQLQQQVATEQTQLENEFAAMESAVAAMQQQSSQLGSMLNSYNAAVSGSGSSSGGNSSGSSLKT